MFSSLNLRTHSINPKHALHVKAVSKSSLLNPVIIHVSTSHDFSVRSIILLSMLSQYGWKTKYSPNVNVNKCACHILCSCSSTRGGVCTLRSVSLVFILWLYNCKRCWHKIPRVMWWRAWLNERCGNWKQRVFVHVPPTHLTIAGRAKIIGKCVHD